MPEPDQTRPARYRWIVLGLAWLCQFCAFWNWFLVPSLATEIYPVLELTQLRYTLIFTMPLVVAVGTSFIGGGLTDRFGIRPIIFVAMLLAGTCGLMRAFIPSFGAFLGLAAMLGLANSFLPSNLMKLVGTWFPSRQIGLATGIYASAQTIGFSVGLATGPQFRDWRIAFLSVGVITVAVAFTWLVLGHNAPGGVQEPRVSFSAGIRRAISSRNVWLTAAIMFLAIGAFQTYTGNMSKALVGVHGLSPAQAGNTAAMLTWGGLVGTLVMPMISDRVGLRRPFIYGGGILAAVFIFLSWQLAPGAASLACVMLGGFGLSGMVTVIFSIPLEFPEIGTRYVGGSAALMNSLGNLGGVLIPLAATPLLLLETQQAYNSGFGLGAVLLCLTALPAWLLVETGWRAKSARRDSA